MNNDITILVLGGYGATGRIICGYLLRETNAQVIIAGRNFCKAEAVAVELGQKFSPERVSARQADASDVASLGQALSGVDFLLVAATTTAWAGQVVEAALQADVDYLDIYFQQDVFPVLEPFGPRIERAGRCFITQAGFHPGLPAALIRQAAPYFDRFDQAAAAFAMNVRIESVESTYELVDSLTDWKAHLYHDGAWRPATYKDAEKFDFGPRLGRRSCVPMDLLEMRALPGMLGIKEAGLYAAGFNWFVDYVLFPLIMVSEKIKRGLLRRFWAEALIWGLNTFSGAEEGVVMLLKAQGQKDGRLRTVEIFCEHASAYDFTAIPVVACVKQYLDGLIRGPGLHMMGHLVDPDRLFKDMEKMGVRVETRVRDEDASGPAPPPGSAGFK